MHGHRVETQRSLIPESEWGRIPSVLYGVVMLSQDSNTVVQHCNAYVGIALEWCASRLKLVNAERGAADNFLWGLD